MKEKLRALIVKLSGIVSEKAGPLLAKIFPKKTEEQIKRRRARGQGAYKTFKIVLGTIVLLVAGVVGAAAYYFNSHDPNKHRAWLLGKIDDLFQSEESTIEKISWGFAIKDVSLGLKISGLKIYQAGTFQRVEIPEFRAYVNLWKLIFGAEPISITLIKPIVELRSNKPNPSLPPSSKSSKPPQEFAWGHAPNWLMNALKKNGGTQISIVKGTLIQSDWGTHGDSKEPNYAVEDINAKIKFSGFPGPVNVEFDSELAIRDQERNLTMVGPMDGTLQGHTEGNSQAVFLFKIAKASLNLDDVSFSYQNTFEKSPKNHLAVEFKGNVQFRDTIFFSELMAIDLNGGKIFYPPLVTEFSLKNEADSPEYRLTWNLPKLAHQDIRLPIRGFRAVGATGVIDSQGDMVIDHRPGSSRGRWRLGLNNLKIDMSELGREIEIENASGSFAISSIFEGFLKDGDLTSDRSELHLDGTASAFTLGRGEFLKPKGDLLTLSIFYSIKKDLIRFKDIKLQMNTLDLESKGTWADYLSSWGSDPEKFGKLSLIYKTNRVNLSDWSSYLQSFKTVPLQGFVEAAGGFNFKTRSQHSWLEDLEWRFDRMNLSNLRGSLDDLGLSRGQAGGARQRSVSGPFSANIVFLGRGKGFIADKAKFIGNVDLRDAVIYFNEKFRKPVGVPAEISMSVDQMRNRAEVRSARLVLNDFEVSLQGSLVRGAPQSRVRALTKRSLDFSKWSNFYLQDEASKKITRGILDWDGSLLLPARLEMEENFDWRDVALQGTLVLKDAEFENPALRGPVMISEARANLGDHDVNLPLVNFSYLGKSGTFSGDLKPLDRKSQQLTLNELINAEEWDARGTLNLSKLDFKDLLGPNANVDMAPNMLAIPTVIPPWWFKTAFFKGSKIDLKLAIDEVEGLGTPLKKFMASVDWNGRSLRIQRFATLAIGGIFSGSFLSDFSNYLDRLESPKHSATLELKKVSWPELESLLGHGATALFSGGTFGGRLTLTADGFDGIEWKKTLKARLEGDLTNSSMQFSKDFSRPLERALMSPELRDYATKDFFAAACQMNTVQAQVDAQILPEELRFDQLKIWSANLNRLDLSGVQALSGELSFTGRLDPNTRCLKGDLRSCLKSIRGSDSLAVKISGPVLNAETSIYNLPKQSELRNCIEGKVTARVQDELLKESRLKKKL